jgi:hypothetical protein
MRLRKTEVPRFISEGRSRSEPEGFSVSLEAETNPGPELVILIALRATGTHMRRTEDALAVESFLRRRVACPESRVLLMLCRCDLPTKASKPSSSDHWSLDQPLRVGADRRVRALGAERPLWSPKFSAQGALPNARPTGLNSSKFHTTLPATSCIPGASPKRCCNQSSSCGMRVSSNGSMKVLAEIHRVDGVLEAEKVGPAITGTGTIFGPLPPTRKILHREGGISG